MDYSEQRVKEAELALEKVKAEKEKGVTLNEHWINFVTPLGKIIGTCVVVHLIWAVVVVKVARIVFVENGWIK